MNLNIPKRVGKVPEPLLRLISQLETMSRDERGEFLIELSNEFSDPPSDIAVSPYPEENRVPNCESEAYVWAVDRESGGLDFHFAVENPQGVSARAVAVTLKDTLSGQPLEDVAAVPADIVDRMFGKRLSMGKGEGLRGLVQLTVYQAKRRIRR